MAPLRNAGASRLERLDGNKYVRALEIGPSEVTSAKWEEKNIRLHPFFRSGLF
jgi:hypothetical protein